MKENLKDNGGPGIGKIIIEMFKKVQLQCLQERLTGVCVGGLLCGGLALLAVGWLSLADNTSTPSNWSESLDLLSVGFGETGCWSSLVLEKENVFQNTNKLCGIGRPTYIYCMLVML